VANLRFITPDRHGALDYGAALGLLAIPVLLGFQGIPFWFSAMAGAGLVAYSLLTDYRLSLRGVISFRTHLALDLAAAAAFAAAPFAFGWTGMTRAYYLAMAAGVAVVVTLSHPNAVEPCGTCESK
jgi:hypothetical protein